MVVKEFYMTRTDGVNLYKSYSNQGMYIKQVQTGNKYESAIDIEDSPYTYMETDEPIIIVWNNLS